MATLSATGGPRRNVSSPNLPTKPTSHNALEESIRTYKLLEALRAGDTALLSTLLSTKEETASTFQTSPLTLATQCATTATINFILNNFANIIDINQRDQYGNTALHYAAKAGRADVVEVLLKQKNINDAILNNDEKQPVDVAKTPEVAEILRVDRKQYIEHVTALFRQFIGQNNFKALQNLFHDPRAAALIDINHQDSSTGATLLHEAVRKKDLEMIEFCLDHGADVSIRDRKGKLALDLAKDDRIKTILKDATNQTSIVITTSPNQQPKLKGYLHKWTNYAGGYKTRWFVLEDGILSYFKNQDDAGNSCRGSINMKIAKINPDSSDRQRFDIIGKGSIRYHLRANHPNEAKKWILALQQSMQWHKTRRSSLNEETSISPVTDDGVRAGRSMQRADDTSSSRRERSRSPSDDSIEADELPHGENYQMSISSARAQIELQKQLSRSLISVISANELSQLSNNKIIVETFEKSLNELHIFVEDVIRMSEDRDSYWQRKVGNELEAKRLWEESMRALTIEQVQMEQVIQDNILEQKRKKRQMRATYSGRSASPISPHADMSHITDKGSQSALVMNEVSEPIDIIQNEVEKYDSDEEFFDAMDAENEELEEVAHALITTTLTTDDFGISQPYIAPSYAGYPPNIRERLPLDQKSLRPEVSLWSILKNSIGKDLSKITLPVYFNEPTSMLQRMAEDMEYSELLDIAASQKGSTERILYVAAFAMSNYSSTVGRIAKPFNPLLGETYEYVRPDKAFRYVSEQVSHHPPISACYCDSPNYEFFAEVDVKSKFWGKSFEIMPKGVSHVNLKVPKECMPPDAKQTPKDVSENPDAFIEHYSWKKVTTCVNNLIVGTPWIDHYGDMVITNHLTGDVCVLTFKARGWRGKDAFEIRGHVKNSQGQEVWEIAGRWNERLLARPRSNWSSPSEDDLSSDATAASANVVDGTQMSPTHYHGKIVLLWKRAPLPEEPMPFNLTPFAITLNDLPDSLRSWLAPTDSRLRPDQRGLENNQYDIASTEKVRLEEKQRSKRRARELGQLPEWKPRWFEHDTEPDTNEGYWKFNFEYWKERERVGKERINGTSSAKWDIVNDDIF